MEFWESSKWVIKPGGGLGDPQHNLDLGLPYIWTYTVYVGEVAKLTFKS